MDDFDDAPDLVAETENFVVYRTQDDDEVAYHIELGTVTLHLLEEEWTELVALIGAVGAD